MFLPEKLKELRIEKKLSQEDFIREISKISLIISRGTVVSWEKGITSPNAVQLALICQFYGVMPSFFFDKKHYISANV